MNLKLIPTPEFSRSAKKLKKRYNRIFEDLRFLEKTLSENPEAGINIGGRCYKIRLMNSSVPTGKRGGFRVIYYLIKNEKIYLLEIYSKNDLDNISDSRIVEILKNNNF